ncbi:MAG: hypothetical protein IPH31_17420 [Lewinellaceae bacterium]|nr:hypothetical protein [Lewinellaceae bacterium]
MMPVSMHSQSKADLAFSKLKTLLRQKVDCNESTYDAFLNKSESMVDIEDRQIPIKEVKILYFYNTDSPTCPHFIKFDCENGHCIVEGVKKYSAFGISLKSKSSCYEFINAFAELKGALR